MQTMVSNVPGQLLPPFAGPDSQQVSNPRVETNNVQGAGQIIQDGGRGATAVNEPSAALPSGQDWLRGARHDKPVPAGANGANFLYEPKAEEQAFLGSSRARMNKPTPPPFGQHPDPRMPPMSNIAAPGNMMPESQIGPLAQDGCRVGPLLGSGGQVLNISYPLQQINYIPIEVLQQQTQPRVTSPYLYNPQSMLVNPTMGGMADVSGSLHPR